MHRKAIVWLFFWSFVTACKQEQVLSLDPTEKEYTYQVIRMKDRTFGYDILQRGKTIVHQPFIPAYGGNQGFVKKRHAKATAQLVMDKMRKGIFPPSVSRYEVDSILSIR